MKVGSSWAYILQLHFLFPELQSIILWFERELNIIKGYAPSLHSALSVLTSAKVLL